MNRLTTDLKKTYSGKQVIKAGEILLRDDILEADHSDDFNQAFGVLSYWRFSHEAPLKNALKMLETVSLKVDRSAIFAKRLKRYVSIIFKLLRFEKMKLKNMQDIGGCRAIIGNEKKLYKIVRELKKHPEFKNSEGKVRYKDYIAKPKNDGYRGYHLIGQFPDGAGETRNIELQIRTKLQHDWATALEIVDLFTGQALKSNQGERDWKEFFIGVSEQFAVMETVHLFDTLDDKAKFNGYYKKLIDSPAFRLTNEQTQMIAHKLNVIERFEAYAHSLKMVDGRIDELSTDGYVLVEVDTQENSVKTTLFPSSESGEAEQRYAEVEKVATGDPRMVVALVSTTAVGGIKEAYPNYFADSTDFIAHLVILTAVPRALPGNLTGKKLPRAPLS